MEPNKGVIIVTGSSRGIGKETARQLLALGFTVAFAESIRIEEHKYGVHSGIVLVGKTAVEPDKEVYDEQGSKRHLAPREGTRIQSMEEVATGIVRALLKRKDRAIMTRSGKLQSLMQRVTPKLLEKIIVRNIDRFEEENK